MDIEKITDYILNNLKFFEEKCNNSEYLKDLFINLKEMFLID